MKILKIAFLLLLTTSISFAQTEEYQSVLDKFLYNYNNGDAKSAHDMMTKKMQETLPLETIERVFVTLDKTVGKFRSYEFDADEGKYQIYLAKFEKGEQKIRMVLNEDNKIAGLLFKPAEDVAKAVPKFERNKTPLLLPFKGEWFVVWGGDTKAQNYHVIDKGQRRAFDILVLGSNNKTHERSGTRNEDYWVFGKPLYAVCDAEVIDAGDGIEDNKPGAMNPKEVMGNFVILKTDKDEFIFYAHFENGTVKVKKGDKVKKGQMIGNAGNSGNSSEPHLHLHMQDGPDLYTGVGVKMFFEEVSVKGEVKTDYSPVRLDRISRPEE